MDHVGMVNLEWTILGTKRQNMYETLVCEILLLFVGSVSRTDCSLDNGLDLVSTLAFGG